MTENDGDATASSVLHEAVEAAREQTVARERRAAAYLIAGSMVATTAYAVWFTLWSADAANHLVVIAVTAVLVYAFALALNGSGRTTAAGVVSTVGGTVPLAGLALVVGEPSMFHLILLGVAMAVPVVIPTGSSVWRLSSGAFVVTAFLYVVLTPGWWGLGGNDTVRWLSEDEQQVAATVNQVGAVVNLIMVGALTHIGFWRTRALLIAERALHRREADTDQLTGLANRRPAQARLKRLARQWQANYALALIDLDDFKEINDDRGHEVGDEVVVAVARALTGRFRASDVVARWGGDEFLVILEGITEHDAARVVSAALGDIRGLDIACEDGPLHVSATAGVAMAGAGDEVDAVLAAADRALYRAKRRGGGQIAIAADVAAENNGVGAEA